VTPTFVLLTPLPPAPPGLRLCRVLLQLHLLSMSGPLAPPTIHLRPKRCPRRLRGTLYIPSFSPPPSTASNPKSTPTAAGTTPGLRHRHWPSILQTQTRSRFRLRHRRRSGHGQHREEGGEQVGRAAPDRALCTNGVAFLATDPLRAGPARHISSHAVITISRAL
jgi:hypothetical protein